MSALSVASFEAKFALEALMDLPADAPPEVRAEAERRQKRARARYDQLALALIALQAPRERVVG